MKVIRGSLTKKMRTMNTVLKKSKDVAPNKYNPNRVSKEKCKALKRLITEFGFLQPILIAEDGTIIDGKHRWRAMKELGFEDIDCVVMEGEENTGSYKKHVTIAINRIHGEHDEDLPKKVINDIAQELDTTFTLSMSSNALDNFP